MRYGIGVDLGGTSIKMGLFTSNGDIVDSWSIKTDVSDNGKNILIDIAKSVSVKLAMKGIDKKQVDGLGIGVPGAVSRGIVDKCINIGWDKVDIVKELEPLCGIKVYADNDANTAALGEYKCGTGADYDGIVFLTLGTGVGGGIIYDGKIIQGFSGYGGEVGHIKVNYDETEPCNCGTCGCLEQYASSTGIRRMALRRLSQGDEESSLRKYGEELTTKDIFIEAEENGDKVANEVIDYAMEMLARACADICHVVNVEAVIIGGGVANAGDFLIDKVRKEFETKVKYIAGDTKICLASLGEKAGIYGAFYLTKM